MLVSGRTGCPGEPSNENRRENHSRSRASKFHDLLLFPWVPRLTTRPHISLTGKKGTDGGGGPNAVKSADSSKRAFDRRSARHDSVTTCRHSRRSAETHQEWLDTDRRPLCA